MGVQEPLRRLLEERVVAEEQSLVRGRETAGSGVVDQLAVGDSAFALDPVQVRVGDDIPQTVSSQPGEWRFGVVNGPGATKTPQQVG